MKPRTHLILAAVIAAFMSLIVTVAPAVAQEVRLGGFDTGTANSLYCKLTGCTMQGQVVVGAGVVSPSPGLAFYDNTAIGVYHPNSARVAFGRSSNAFIDIDTTALSIVTVGTWNFSGNATDVTTGTNEDFTVAPNGTGAVTLTANKVNLGGHTIHTNAPFSVTSGTCTSETLRSGGSEWTGEVTATCTGQTWVVLWTTTYTTAPVCVLTEMNAAAKADVGTTLTTSTTGLTVTVTTATTSGIWSYSCVEG